MRILRRSIPAIVLLVILTTIAVFILLRTRAASNFNGDRAYQDVLAQVSFGPRTPGSTAHIKTIQYITLELERAGWTVTLQQETWQGHAVTNIIASRAGAVIPALILGAHYDTRISADRDTGQAVDQPVPGANDGASGVAVLLELARTLPEDVIPLWLVFFDAEDNGNLPGWDWIIGSRLFYEKLTYQPQAVVIVDMVGDSDLDLPIEANSDPELAAEIWDTASELGYSQFSYQRSNAILDDHTPFVEAGIPAVDIIDIAYPYWHTLEDTSDKVSPNSLQAVGETLLTWLRRK
jgi:glutaminyl-peptide cyclotransferase